MHTSSPKRRIILHAGFHKTGTTSLQACLRSNSRLLAPLWRVNTRIDNDALRCVLDAARDYSASGDDEDLAMVGAQSILWLSSLDMEPGSGLLVSSEDFSGHMPGRLGVKHYLAAAKILAKIVEMASILFDGHVQFEILFTTRERSPWLRSLYFQQAKHPDLVLDFDDFCASIPKAADHEAAVMKVRRKLGPVPVHLVSLEDLSSRRLGPAEAMFDIAGLPKSLRSSLVAITRRNSNPGEGIVLSEQLVAANRLGLSQPRLRKMKDDLIAAAVSKAEKLG